MIPLVLVGAAGRMGRAVELAARETGEFEIRARVVRSAPAATAAAPAGSSEPWIEDAAIAVRPGDVVIEFSSPAGCRDIARLCAERGASLVSGTTGLSAEDEGVLRESSKRIAVLRATNFSLGVAALHRALAAALDALPASWDVEIIERHHRRKTDSPSGTALALARRVQEKRGSDPSVLRHGREGRSGEREAGEIGLHAVRGGSWVGDHTVLLAGEGEWVELRHVAQDRAAFASGALAGARFVARARPGLYTLDDVISGR